MNVITDEELKKNTINFTRNLLRETFQKLLKNVIKYLRKENTNYFLTY